MDAMRENDVYSLYTIDDLAIGESSEGGTGWDVRVGVDVRDERCINDGESRRGGSTSPF